MAKIIKPRERVTDEYYVREFQLKKYSDGGYSFPCDENGTLLDTVMDCAKENYKKCLDGTHEVIDKGIVKRKNSYVEDAILLCNCGEEVQLTGSYYGANQCGNCGQWYNLNGQELNPPEEWLEDFEED